MRHSAQPLLLFSALLFTPFLMSAETTPFPLGTSDLSPTAQLAPFKSIEDEIKAHTWKWEAPEIKVDLDTHRAEDSEFQLSQPSELEQLQIENKALKARVSELELRVAALEKHLRPQD